MPETSILILGGGPAGLSTAGALKKRGLEAVILDKDKQIGGGWLRRYERLKLHSVRAYSGLAHYPIPADYPRYVPKDRFAEYLQEYARRWRLNFFGDSPIRSVQMAETASGPRYRVETEDQTWEARVVVIATGQFGIPMLPPWPGRDEYRGCLVHSFRYRSGREFAGRRALVIGAGNSGAEIAADLAERGAASVALSIRTPPPVVPRDFMGVSSQAFSIALSRLPRAAADRITMRLARLALGDLTRYGMPPPAWRPFTAHRIPIIDVGFVRELKRGRVQVRPNIGRFTRSGVVFGDGSAEAFDVVVVATGFQTGLDRLIRVPGVLDRKGEPQYRSGQPTGQPGFYFMGYTDSHRGHLFEANLDSRRLARIIERDLN